MKSNKVNRFARSPPSITGMGKDTKTFIAPMRKSSAGLWLRKAKEFMSQRKLVPDDLIIGLIRGRILESDCKGGFMLDGFPRTVAQAEALDATLQEAGLGIDHVVSFGVDRAELIERLGGRLVCTKCGASFHERSKSPDVAGRCDSCSATLIKRDDDRPEVVTKRLETFLASTQPVELYFRDKGRLRFVDASGSETVVFERILKAIGLLP